ncbi:MAG TPA: hypothetical protein V6D22_05905 [Candidatus Obscuribacterales bacterium]
MSQRNKEGATLALTVTAVFFIVILGVGFFFLVQLLGGGREAQHATDSGNLNVAKQALVKPAVDPQGNEGNEFAGLFNVNNQADLKDYDRFVGKALLVALNASEEGTPTALAHAQTVITEVEGKGDSGTGGIGERLYTQLNTVGQTTNFFDSLAKSNSLRMLNWNQGNQIATDPTAYHVAFMRQNADAATNVHIVPGVVPPGSQHSALTTSSTNYLVGYTPISVTVSAGGANTTLTLYGVPVRPNQEPHLVSQQQFLAETSTQMPDGGNSLIPPNAFQSQSNALEMHGGNVQTRSSAIVGVIDAAGSNFNAEIPQGYIVINNTGSASNAYNPNGSDPFAGQLMGAGVFMAQAGPSSAFFSTNPSDFSTVANAQYDDTGNIPMSTLNGTNFQPSSPAMTQGQLNAMHDYLVNNGGSADQCNNVNSFAMESGGASHAVNPNCETEVADVYNALRTAGGGPGAVAGNLMAIEYLKAEVIRIRGAFDSDGCGSINPSTNLVTGLKAYNHPLNNSEINRDPFGNNNDTTVPTLGQLLSQTNANGAIQAQIRQRLNEMHATASSADLDAAFNQPVPFDKVSYLYWNGSSYASTTTPPNGWDVSFQAADGNQVAQFSQDNTLTDRYINVSGDGGFPHPFDCPPSFTGFTKDSTLWTPGSGYKNLLGVVQFTNTADVGVTWCCPC